MKKTLNFSNSPMMSVLVGLSYGDEAKAKWTANLIKSGSYDLCVRFNGGCNAGHTVYKDGTKFVLHLVPIGVLYGVKSLIGPGCVVHEESLAKEIAELQSLGVENIENLLFISANAHITTQEHIDRDKSTNKIGTTGRGIGPTYADRCLRVTHRVFDVASAQKNCKPDISIKELTKTMLDPLHGLKFCGATVVEPISFCNGFKHILAEGAQGYGLDINHGDYPFVTSSDCLAHSAFSVGVPLRNLANVFGICKIYETYVGSKVFEDPNDPDYSTFLKIREVGKERGATTGRNRQIGWLNLDFLMEAIYVNSANRIMINKCDVLESVGVFKLFHQSKLLQFDSLEDMKKYISKVLAENFGDKISDIIYSNSPFC